MGVVDRARLALGRDLTLGTMIDKAAQAYGDRRLVEEAGGGLQLTAAEGADLVAKWSAAIRARISPGDRVVVAADNGYALFLLCVAASRAGGVAVPVNPKMQQAEIDHAVSDSAASLVLHGPDDLDVAEPDDPSPASPDDVAAVFYTSGTTGKPKGARLTHRALLGSGHMMALLPTNLRRDEVVSGLPVAHIAGFSMLILGACAGIPVYLLRKFRPDDALDAIESRRATIFIGVPAMYRMMLEAGAAERDLRSVRLWASGADKMPDDLMREFKRFGASATLPVIDTSVGEAMFIDGYGMVELAGGVAVRVSLPNLNLPIGSSAVIPLPPYKLKVVGEDEKEVRLGQVGELVVKGPGVMKGYHGNDEATSRSLTSDGWLRTGDLARRGPFGIVEFAGRKKDVIKHGGYSVFAVEVQTALEEHPEVAECAVIGLPDERKGEIPAAVVRRTPGSTVSEDELVTWGRDHMADYKAPQRVVFVDELPRTGTDKVQKDALRPLFG
jgi:acyl-CoA synthetase (AMP-forming)/AMP-acid ligase II